MSGIIFGEFWVFAMQLIWLESVSRCMYGGVWWYLYFALQQNHIFQQIMYHLNFWFEIFLLFCFKCAVIDYISACGVERLLVDRASVLNEH